jgi:hypothetical protein
VKNLLITWASFVGLACVKRKPEHTGDPKPMQVQLNISKHGNIVVHAHLPLGFAWKINLSCPYPYNMCSYAKQ